MTLGTHLDGRKDEILIEQQVRRRQRQFPELPRGTGSAPQPVQGACW